MAWYLSPYCSREGSYHPGFDLEKGKSLIMRIPVVDTRGVTLMPCTPAKARHLFESGKARPKRNKLGLFYVQLCYEQEPANQPLVVGVDPGSKFEGLSVVGTKETVLRSDQRGINWGSSTSSCATNKNLLTSRLWWASIQGVSLRA